MSILASYSPSYKNYFAHFQFSLRNLQMSPKLPILISNGDPGIFKYDEGDSVIEEAAEGEVMPSDCHSGWI